MAGLRRLLEASDGLATAATPTTTNRTGGGGRGAAETTPQANFDTNMVIILAALLCALICALGLNSMVRCFMRCSHRFGFESSQQAAARTGLKKSALKKIPIFIHGSDNSGPTVEDSSLNSECAICLGEFIDGEKIRVLPKCNHTFHVRCIDTWLGSHSSCPNCRHSLLESFKPSIATTSGGLREEPPRQGGGGEEQVVVVQVNDVS